MIPKSFQFFTRRRLTNLEATDAVISLLFPTTFVIDECNVVVRIDRALHQHCNHGNKPLCAHCKGDILSNRANSPTEVGLQLVAG